MIGPLDFTTVLIAYTALVATVIGGIMTFLLVHFVPVKSRVQTLWREMYGAGGTTGHIEEAEEDVDSLRDKIDGIADDHREQQERLDEIEDYLEALSGRVSEAPDGDFTGGNGRWRRGPGDDADDD